MVLHDARHHDARHHDARHHDAAQPHVAQPSDAMARVEAQMRSASEAVERAREFREELARVRGRGRDGVVQVEVDASGMLVGLECVAGAAPGAPSLLLDATRVAHRAALADALRQVETHTRRVWGDDPVAERIVDEVAERFGMEVAP